MVLFLAGSAFAKDRDDITPKRPTKAEVEHWRCLVNERHRLKFQVIEGQMRALAQSSPTGMTEMNSMQCWGWIEG